VDPVNQVLPILIAWMGLAAKDDLQRTNSLNNRG